MPATLRATEKRWRLSSDGRRRTHQQQAERQAHARQKSSARQIRYVRAPRRPSQTRRPRYTCHAIFVLPRGPAAAATVGSSVRANMLRATRNAAPCQRPCECPRTAWQQLRPAKEHNKASGRPYHARRHLRQRQRRVMAMFRHTQPGFRGRIGRQPQRAGTRW